MRHPFDQKDTVYLSIVGPFSFYGTSEVHQKSPTSFVNIRCISSTAKTLSIERENFEILLK